ncbi:PKD domain-containing protein [Chloroflexota bacterium]
MRRNKRFIGTIFLLGMLLFSLIPAAAVIQADDTEAYFLHPPGTEWGVLYGDNVWAYSIDQSLGGYIVAGTQWDPSTSLPAPVGPDTRAALLKLDTDGTVQYYHPVMNPADPDPATAAFSVDIVPDTDGIGDNGYAVTGYKRQQHGDFNQRDLWLMRTDQDGNFYEEYVYGGLGDHWGNSIVKLYDEVAESYDFVIGGRRADESNLAYNGWLLRTDSTGTTELSRHGYDGTDEGWLYHEIFSTQPTSDGGYIAGTEYGMVKADFEGDFLWRVAEVATDYYYSVIQTSDGGYIGVGARDGDVLLTKVDAAGTPEWSRTFGETGHTDWGRSVIQASGGGYALACTTSSYGHGGMDVWFIKTDASGLIEWDLVLGGSGGDVAYDLVEDTSVDPGFVIAGMAEFEGADHMWIIKVKSVLQPPIPAFTYTPDSPVFLGQEITFDATPSTDADGTIVSYEWDFGDENTATGLTAQHTYPSPGNYTVTLTVTDDDGIFRSASQEVNIVELALQWERYIGGDEWDIGFDIVEAWDGGYVIAGYSSSSPSYMGSPDAWLFKTDANGNVDWERRFADQTGNPALNESAQSLDRTLDGGYVLTGVTGIGIAGTDYSDVWLIKTDVDGAQFWYQEFGGDFNDEGLSVASTPDGGYIIGGMTSTGGLDKDFWLIKTDSDGIMDWDQVYDEPDPDMCNAVAPTSDNGYIATGNYGSTGDGALPLIKTDAAGVQDWQQEWTDPYPQDNFGYWTSEIAGEGFVVAGGYERDVSLMKVDNLGAKVWEQYYGGEYDDCGYAAAKTPDGGYIIAGFGQLTQADDDVYLVKTDSEGNLEWEATYGTGTTYDSARGIIPLADGSYIILANQVPLQGKGDVWLFKIGPNHFPEPAFTYTPEGPWVDEDITFDASTTADVDGSIASYLWDFGDGNSGSGEVVQHAYTTTGDKLVSLTVIDDDGAAASTSQTVHVSLELSANFIATPLSGPAPLTVDFTDLTSGGTSPYTYEWDMDGDDATDEVVMNPDWEYTDPGIYSVTLEVTDDAGRLDTETKADYIVVSGVSAVTPGVTIDDSSVTDSPADSPGLYDLSGVPDDVEMDGARGFVITASGDDGTYTFRITFETPVDYTDFILYKLPGWEEIPYTIIDEYTIEIELDIVGGVLDPPFILAGTMGTVTGFVWHDENSDGVMDAGEDGIAGVTIELKVDSTVVASTTTGGDGSYNFYMVTPGSYNVDETDPAGYASTTPNSLAVVVTAGGTITANFGDIQTIVVLNTTFSTGWNMFSLPLNPDPLDWDYQLGDEISPLYIYYYDPVAHGYRMYPSTSIPLANGLGYWAKVYADTEIAVEGSVVSDEPQAIHMLSGWNQIGQSFNYPVDWGDVMVYNTATEETVDILTAHDNGWVTKFLYWYDPGTGGYIMETAPDGVLTPWLGYWVRSLVECDLIIPNTPML